MERLDLLPVATRPDVGVSFFATLLPQPAELVSVTAIGADGQVLQPEIWPSTRKPGSGSCGAAVRRLELARPALTATY